ncbi:ATP-binding protein [Segnochrobactraceae bacterium EtOH-i3]
MSPRPSRPLFSGFRTRTRILVVGGLVIVVATLLSARLVQEHRQRVDEARLWMGAALDHGVTRLEAELARVDHMTRLLSADGARALADPQARATFTRQARQLAEIFDQPMPTLLVAPGGTVILDLSEESGPRLKEALLPKLATAPTAGFILVPSPPAGDRSAPEHSGYVVRLHPLPLGDGPPGFVVVAIPAGLLFRDALTLSPPLSGQFHLVDADGQVLAPPQSPVLPVEPFRSGLQPEEPDAILTLDDPELGPLLAASRPVADGALKAVETVPLAGVLATWRTHALILTAIAVFIIAVLIGVLIDTTRQARRRIAREQAYARQLEALAEATAELAAAPDLDVLLRTATDWIRVIIPAHQSIASVTRNADFAQAVHAISFSERYARWRDYDRPSDGSGIYRLVCRDNRPMRLTQAELVAHPAWRGFGVARTEHPPMRGWLAVPLIARDGGNLGLLQLTDRESGDFTAADESLLVQVARLVAVRLETLDVRAAREAALAAVESARAEAEDARTALARILSSISDGVCVVDRDWRVRYLNPHATSMLSGALALGADLWTAAPDLGAPRLRERLVRAMDSGQGVRLSLPPSADGRVHNLSAFPFEDGLTLVLTDRTRQSEIEAQLRQTQKMEALGQLTGGVAHDFNNLLTVILGNGDIIVETVGNNRPALTAARLLLTAAERASALTDRLLSFARRQPLAPCAVDVATLVGEMRDLLVRTLGERIEVRVVTEDRDCRALIDPGQMETALLNLALNARDAMPEGGVLTLTTRVATVDADFAEAHPGVEPGRHVVLSVTDTGTGMDPEVRARAFEPFFTTKERGVGSGLGLSMVYGFAHQSGGHAEITSTPGAGTTVRLYLRAESAAANFRPQTALVAAPTGSEHILLVEDDALVREHVRATLAALGYHITTAGSGPEAETAAAAVSGFDLLLTDVVLPGPLNGRVLAERLRARDPGLRVLFMSGYAEDDILMRDGAAALGARLLQKPFRRQDIAALVCATLNAAPASASPRAKAPKPL